MKRGKYLLLALCVLLVLSLCSCGKKAVKTEEEMLADYMDATAEKFTDAVVTIDSRKTDTDNKTDEVYIVICTNDGIKEMKRTVYMGYHLYDDGWQLDGYTVVGESFKPLKEPEIIEADIAEKVSAKYGGTTEQVSVGEVSGSLEDGKYSGKVTCLNVHKYMNESFTFEAEWKFDVSLGVWSLYLNKISSEEDWSKLQGWFGKHNEGIVSFSPSGNTGYLTQAYYNTTYNNYFTSDVVLKRIPTSSFHTFVENYYPRTNWSGFFSAVANGASLQLQGTQLSEFLWYDGNTTGYGWLIGKDHVALRFSQVSQNSSTNRITVKLNIYDPQMTNSAGIPIS